MRSLIIIVEGETEHEFVKRVLIPYLVEVRGLNTGIHSIMIKMSGGGHGFNNIEHFKNTIAPVLHYSNQPVITTLLDHYGINSDAKMPGYSKITTKNVAERISKMEAILNSIVQEIKPYRYFVPYIQQHEIETLLFANPKSGFELAEDKRIMNDVILLCAEYESIEDINCTPEGAPSKRLEKIYKEYNQRYDKVTDAVDIIVSGGGIEPILEQCPRFKKWIDKLIDEVKKG